MMLHQRDVDRDRLWLARGTQGRTVQSVEAEREDGHVVLTLSHINRGRTSLELAPAEARALADWLAPVPHPDEEARP